MILLAERKYGRTAVACYTGFVTQAICANFIPMLYLTFRRTYNIPFSKLAAISTVFFLTQLTTDFLCAGIVPKIGYRPCVIAAEILSGAGLAMLSFLPNILPSPFAGIMICVVVYAAGSGLTEVLVSPIIEACPFGNKEGAMSLLHSSYCWGSVLVILASTLFFRVFGIEKWPILALIWSAVPFLNIFNFAVCPIEETLDKGGSIPARRLLKTKTFWVLCLLMACAGASELAMEQWASAFAESALGVSKAVGDSVGLCGFMLLMGLCRTLYGKFGGKIKLMPFMVFSGVLCVGCYLLAGLANAPVLGLIGCAVCGFSVGIMWPGSISTASNILPGGGTAMFAFLALAGDLGGSIGPAVVGNISQAAGGNLKAGVLSGVVFPVALVVCALSLSWHYGKKPAGNENITK